MEQRVIATPSPASESLKYTEGRIVIFNLIWYGSGMVVRMRHTRAHTANRRSHHALVATTLAKCECGAVRVSHRACAECGRYRGRVVIDVAAKAKRKAAKAGSKSEASK